MNIRLTVGAITLIAATAFATSAVLSQEHPSRQDRTQDHPQPGDAGMGIDEEMMARWQAMATPGEHHERLGAFVGTWDQTTKFWMTPESPPQESKSSVTYDWILGKRFIKGEYTGEVMGSPFQGIDILGYDNFREQYISLWIDNMSTAFMTARGKYDADRNAIITTGRVDDIMTGERDKLFRNVTRIIDENNMIFEMYTTGPDGKEFKALEVRSTRQSASEAPRGAPK